MIGAGCFLPPRRVGIRDHGVAGGVEMHFGQFNAVGVGQIELIDLCPADHHGGRTAREAKGGGDVMRDFCPLPAPASVAGEDDVATAGQQAGQAVECLAAHDHRVTEGQRLEMLEVCGQPPRQPPVLADHAIVGAGEDEDDFLLLGHRVSRVTWPILRPGRASCLP